MGGLLVESNRVSTDSEEFFVANDIQDAKRKKRRPRKSKLTLPACSSMAEIYSEATTSSHRDVSNGLPNGDSISTPVVHGNGQTVNGNLQNRQETIFSNSVSETAGPVLLARPSDYHSRRTIFPPHRSVDDVSKALERGELLRALFRVNAHNRLEAYCKIEGVQTDVLISGVVAQNRAVEGDTVAIDIDPPSMWPRLKGYSDTPNNSHDVRGKSNISPECENISSSNDMVFPDDVVHYNGSSSRTTLGNGHSNVVLDNGFINGHDSMILFEKLCSLISLFPSKRPTGQVVAVIEKSARRDNIVGFLGVKQWISSRESKQKYARKNKPHSDLNQGYILLTPTDPKLTKMTVQLRSLPEIIKKRLEACDLTIESDLVAAKLVDWAEECYVPDARVVQVFGRGSDVEAQISAILYENGIDDSEFSPEVLSCLPCIPWEVPHEELESRVDLRNLCVFTIDPSSATDLDDALSVEKLPNGVFRVGVHIADVSYFFLPDTALDIDAQFRSTSVYLLRGKLPMLPQMLSDNVASLNPGVDRLTFSIFWDINSKGEILDRWIGRTVIRSCGKLSYEHAQGIIDGSFNFQDSKHWPKLYGPFEWRDVISSVKVLHEISIVLRENRFKNGALSLESPKVVFLFDEDGLPYDSVVSGQTDSNFLVVEFMLLANVTAAEVITRSYPSCALLRRHPEPNVRKLREFEAFCYKHGLKLDISSSANLHHSLKRIRGELENDSVFVDVLMSYAARPMQLAAYFCSGEFKDVGDYRHYGLGVPLYTHFTSPLRRYPDIVVHRTLAAALDAEDILLKRKKSVLGRCFSGVRLNKDEIESVEGREALCFAGLKYGVVGGDTLAGVASHCNDRKLAARHVKDATDRVYMWAMLKRKEILYSEARVLGLGPKFMSVYIPKLAIERRIYYDEVDGLMAEWLDTTSTLVLSQFGSGAHNYKQRKSSQKTMDDVALIASPSEVKLDEVGISVPAFFPLTVQLLSTIPVAVHAVGGDDGPLDVVVRLYMSSYAH